MKTSKIKTYSGFEFEVRPLRPADDPLVAEFWTHVSHESADARFLGVHDPRLPIHAGAPIDQLHDASSTFLAIGGDGSVISVAVLSYDREPKTARIMVFTRDGATFHGVSWALLAQTLEIAHAAGIETVSSVFNVTDLDAIRLELKMGFVESDYPGKPTLRLLRWSWPAASQSI